MPMKIMVSIAAMMLLAGYASAQAQATSANSQAAQPAAATGPIPRMADGHPNLGGMWFTRPWQAAQANGGFFSNLVPADGGALRSSADPPAGAVGGNGRGGGGAGRTRPKYLPAAAAIQQELEKHYAFEDPEGLCQLPGVPRAFFTPPYPYQFIQDEKSLTMLLEYVEDSRIIPISNAPHPKNYWTWNGDSRARWEGDTLVVDVANFNGRAWLDTLGDFFDENLHVVEKFTMTDHDTIAYEITATDPTIFAEPWVNRRTFYRQPDTEQILEYSCKEGERSIQHYTDDLGGTAKTELKRPTQ
jgi:hypothetical protein